jgi:hypothetical protein
MSDEDAYYDAPERALAAQYYAEAAAHYDAPDPRNPYALALKICFVSLGICVVGALVAIVRALL